MVRHLLLTDLEPDLCWLSKQCIDSYELADVLDTLGYLGQERSVVTLREFLNHKAATVRAAAIRGVVVISGWDADLEKRVSMDSSREVQKLWFSRERERMKAA